MFAVMMCSRAGTWDLIGDAWHPVYHVTTICGEDTRGAAIWRRIGWMFTSTEADR